MSTPQSILPCRATWTLAAALLVAACCPEGKTSDEGTADGAQAGSARLSTLQEEVLDRHCVTDCHEGVNAASNLRLEREQTYRALVNQASQQLTGKIRVVPGDPESSYLIIKMEGGAGMVGVQMPRLAPPRPQSEINALRGWISRGAPDD